MKYRKIKKEKKPRPGSLKRLNKIDKPLAERIKKKKREDSNKISSEGKEIMDTTEI